ncbi:MAG: CDP-diacylglycerol--serine O-phosphatidyltransferase [Bryobacteraceae bacterium]
MKHIREHLIDPHSPDRKPRRAAYALPTFFTAGNVFLGFYSIMESFRGAMETAVGSGAAAPHFSAAAHAIGWAVLLDGLDGRIARMTNTVSDFGREMDSMADVVTFGIAPAVMAFAWGMQFTDAPPAPFTLEQLRGAGYLLSFLYLLCGAMRLARFNISVNPMPKNPGRPGRKYFIGLAIPAGAAVIASIVYFAGNTPITSWVWSVAWLALLALLSFLMVSTWRYPSFKDLNLLQPQSRFNLVIAAVVIWMIVEYRGPTLLAMALAYVSSGIVIRIGGIIRRRWRGHGGTPTPRPEAQLG